MRAIIQVFLYAESVVCHEVAIDDALFIYRAAVVSRAGARVFQRSARSLRRASRHHAHHLAA